MCCMTKKTLISCLRMACYGWAGHALCAIGWQCCVLVCIPKSYVRLDLSVSNLPRATGQSSCRGGLAPRHAQSSSLPPREAGCGARFALWVALWVWSVPAIGDNGWWSQQDRPRQCYIVKAGGSVAPAAAAVDRDNVCSLSRVAAFLATRTATSPLWPDANGNSASSEANCSP